jgi:hypothetical protein
MDGRGLRAVSHGGLVVAGVLGALLLIGAPGYLYFLLGIVLYAVLVAELRLQAARRDQGLPDPPKRLRRVDVAAGLIALGVVVVGIAFGARPTVPTVLIVSLLSIIFESVALRSERR